MEEQKQLQMRKAMIATPTLSGKIDVQYVHSLQESVKLGLTEGWDLFPVFVSGESLLQRARNDLMFFAQGSDIEQMVWIDSDQFWDWPSLKKILELDYDMVGAPIRMKNVQEAYNVKKKKGKMIENKDGLMEVASVGTGFLKMSKKAIDKLWKKSQVYSEDDGKREKRMVFDIKINKDGDFVGEDVALCEKWRSMKGKVYIIPDMVIGHIGEVPFAGNFKEWLSKNKI